MRLLHYAKTPITALRDVQNINAPDAMKPDGLWVSVEGERDWKEWCEAEQFRLDYWKVEQEIVLQDNVLQPLLGGKKEGVLHLYSPLCLDEFTKQYYDAGPRYAGLRNRFIDWAKVASIYDGIVISPYIYARRMDLFWYYPWDAASGCIWRPSKVVAAVGVGQPVEFKKEVYEDDE